MIHNVEDLTANIQPRLAESLRLGLDTLGVNVEHGDARTVCRKGLGQAEPDPTRSARYDSAVTGDVEQLRDLLHRHTLKNRRAEKNRWRGIMLPRVALSHGGPLESPPHSRRPPAIIDLSPDLVKYEWGDPYIPVVRDVKIWAAVSRDAARPPELETLELEEPRAGEILVRIVATGICHTDINVHERDRSPKPIVLGHEGAGIVERVGSGVTRFAPGDPVILSANFCGECPSCRENAHSYCYEVLPRNFGGRRPDGSTPLSQGGRADQRAFFRPILLRDPRACG